MVEPMVRLVSEFGKDHGLIHEAVVTGQKVGAGEEFWSKLAHNEELFAKTVVFVERDGQELAQEVPISIPLPLTEAEKAAIEILGSAKVLTQAQVKSEIELPIRYSEDTLRACAKENAEGRDWRLVYLLGNSLREERERVGTNRKRQPCFDKDYTWWLEASENDWATQKLESGYYLIDFNGRFARTSWHNQEKAVEKLGQEFGRAHEAMVAESVLRIFEATGERLLPNWWHWGPFRSSDGYRVLVGGFVSGGLEVRDCDPDWGDFDVLRVCLFRKFEEA